MSQLTTATITQELQQEALLAMEQLTTTITLLVLHTAHRPEGIARGRGFRANAGSSS